MDREKVIKGLYACTTFGEDGVTDGDCKICPYDKGYATGECWVQMNRDTLALLKDDETRIQYLKDHIAMCKEEIERLKEQEAVVRCKDCIYKEEHTSPYWKYWCNRLKCGCDDDWFCADGERGTDDA